VDVAKQSIKLAVPPPPREEPPAAAPAPLAVRPSRAPFWSVDIELAATATVGLLPGASPGARVDTRAAPPGFPGLMLRFDAWPFASTGDGRGGDFRAVAVGAGVCPELRRRRVGIGGCLAVSLGSIHATGRGVAIPGESTSTLALLEAELGARMMIVGPVWVRLSGGVAGGHRPDDWHFDAPAGQTVIVYRPWPVALQGSLGLCINLDGEIRKTAASPASIGW
jgi:hypothetical protein